LSNDPAVDRHVAWIFFQVGWLRTVRSGVHADGVGGTRFTLLSAVLSSQVFASPAVRAGGHVAFRDSGLLISVAQCAREQPLARVGLDPR
jgi:hypothetical protein